MFKVVPEVPKPLLIFLNSCFFILFWLNVYFFLLVQTVDLSPSFLPFAVPCIFSFTSFFIAFTFSSILRPYSTISVSILITSVLNPASDRLTICSLFSYIFSGVLIYSFIWAIYFLSPSACYIVRGGASGVHQGEATHIAGLCALYVGREVLEGRMLLAQLSAGFHYPQANWASAADSWADWLVYVLGLGGSPQCSLL